jgi:hypothetical protein
MMLDQYREEFTQFNEAIAREEYLHYSGQKESFELEPIYDRYGHLFTRESIQSLKCQLDSASEHFETARAAIRLLLAFALEQFMASRVRCLTEVIAEAEAHARILWDGAEITFHQSSRRLTTEPDPNRRRELQRRRLRVVSETNDLRSERLAALHAAARELGHDNYLSLLGQIRPYDLASLSDECLSLIKTTEELFRTHLRRAFTAEVGLPVEMADRADVAYFLSLSRFNAAFPKGGLRAAYRATMQLMGIDIEKQKNIGIDDENRPQKHPRAFCSPIRVPEEIKLVIAPVGGPDDYLAFFHEAGHAQHFAWTSSSLVPEFKYAGDSAVSEGYAFLFNYLIHDRRWLEAILGLSASEEFLQLATLNKLFLLRRYAAKMEYEMVLHVGADSEGLCQRYSELLTQATGFRYPPEEFLIDLDDGLYSADYLRAWKFESLLRDHLKTKFGHRWWMSKSAVGLLIDVWNTGERYTVEELAKLLGLGDVSIGPLVDEMAEMFRERKK